MYVTICGQELAQNPLYLMCSEFCPAIDLPKQTAPEDKEKELAEYQFALDECKAMIQHFIQLNDKSEIAYWRGALKNIENNKRRLKNL